MTCFAWIWSSASRAELEIRRIQQVKMALFMIGLKRVTQPRRANDHALAAHEPKHSRWELDDNVEVYFFFHSVPC